MSDGFYSTDWDNQDQSAYNQQYDPNAYNQSYDQTGKVFIFYFDFLKSFKRLTLKKAYNPNQYAGQNSFQPGKHYHPYRYWLLVFWLKT